MNVVLWILQVLLAGLFLFAGGVKLVMTPEQLTQGPGPAMPVLFLRFIAVCEILGALGLLLPGIFRIRKGLTSLAACGLVIIMVGAVGTTLVGGFGIGVAVIPVIAGLVAGFIAYGRWGWV